MTFYLKIPGPPRTKKTSNRLVGFGAPCKLCGRPPYNKVLPSEAHEKWFNQSMLFAPLIRRQLEKMKVVLPIKNKIQVRALFYRERDDGDLVAYEQALGDYLQEPKQSRKNPGKLVRNGAGVIADDKQIASWDGSRLMKDKDNPRIECEISTLDDGFQQEELGLLDG